MYNKKIQYISVPKKKSLLLHSNFLESKIPQKYSIRNKTIFLHISISTYLGLVNNLNSLSDLHTKSFENAVNK